MKATAIISQLDKDRIPQNYRSYLKFLLRLNQHIVSNQKSFIPRYLKDQEIMVELIKFQHSKSSCKIFEYICHYFNCIPLRNEKYYIIIGFDLDAMMCRIYFITLLKLMESSIVSRINKHTSRTHYQRKRRRLGIPYKDMLHGTKFASNLRAKMINDFIIVIEAILQSNARQHRDLNTYNKLKRKTLRYVSSDVRKSITRVIREHETSSKDDKRSKG